jgi:hypothetical protein
MASGHQANRPLSKTFCESCRQAFTPRDAMQMYQDKYYHPNCFRCNSCGNSLAGKPFYPKPNNQFQCESCNDALAPTYVRKILDLLREEMFILVVVYVIERFNPVHKQNDFKIVIIIVIAFGKDFSNHFLIKNFFSLAVVNAKQSFLMVNIDTTN